MATQTIRSKELALRLLRETGAEIVTGTAHGVWLWTPNRRGEGIGGKRRISERLVWELEEAGEIVRSDDNRSRCGRAWVLPNKDRTHATE